MALNPAVTYSFEHRMHEQFCKQQGMFALHKFRQAAPGKAFEYVPMMFPLGVAYRAVHPLVRVSRHMDPNQQGSEFGSVEDANQLKHKQHTLDPLKSFMPGNRIQLGKHGEMVRLQISGYDRGQFDGWWVTEYTKLGSRTIHCLPAERLDALSGTQNLQKLQGLANFPILQRWVGVQYHPETEIESHYGEMVMSKCYDLAVFVDETHALDVDLTSTCGVSVTAALTGDVVEDPAPQQVGDRTVTLPKQNRRLLMEYRRILKNPIEYIETRPLDTNILEWHFVITGCQDPYIGGKYHGILEFPDDFPMKPPSIKMLTPSGILESELDCGEDIDWTHEFHV